jgi:hypothetical protein
MKCIFFFFFILIPPTSSVHNFVIFLFKLSDLKYFEIAILRFQNNLVTLKATKK